MADFFSILMSQNGEKLSLLGIHPQVSHALGDNLRATFPHKIASDRAREDGIHIIELRKGLGKPTCVLLQDSKILTYFIPDRLGGRSHGLPCVCTAVLQLAWLQARREHTDGQGVAPRVRLAEGALGVQRLATAGRQWTRAAGVLSSAFLYDIDWFASFVYSSVPLAIHVVPGRKCRRPQLAQLHAAPLLATASMCRAKPLAQTPRARLESAKQTQRFLQRVCAAHEHKSPSTQSGRRT